MSYRKTQLNDIRKKIHDQNGLITKDIETVKRTQQILELKNSVNEDRFQDGGKSWAHLLSQTQQIHNYIWNNSLWRELRNWINRASQTKDSNHLERWKGLLMPLHRRQKKNPKHMDSKNNREYIQENYKTERKGNPTLKGLRHRLPQPRNQH